MNCKRIQSRSLLTRAMGIKNGKCKLAKTAQIRIDHEFSLRFIISLKLPKSAIVILSLHIQVDDSVLEAAAADKFTQNGVGGDEARGQL